MFPHFTGDMRKHIALTRKIDTKHRARFRYDLLFLRHRMKYTLEPCPLNQPGCACTIPIGATQAADIRPIPGVSTMHRSVDVRSMS